MISNLPVYTGAKDGSEEQTKIIYTIKEDRAAIPGYKAMDTALLDSSAGELQNKMAAPGDTMLLEAYEGEGRETRNRFVNYLPEYSVSGRVVWDVEDSSYPEIESYFEDYFAVIEEDRDYVCHTVTYSKDEEKENIWNFSITGLFTTNEDGSAASYVLHPQSWNGLKQRLLPCLWHRIWKMWNLFILSVIRKPRLCPLILKIRTKRERLHHMGPIQTHRLSGMILQEAMCISIMASLR